MKIAERMSLLKPSGTISMAEKARKLAKNGREILNLSIGDPNFDTPSHIKKAVFEALKKGFTHYTSSRGILELREAISEDLKKKGIRADPEEEIIITPGSKHAIYGACQATLNPEDEILILSPAWPTHYTCAEFAGARIVEIPCGNEYNLDEHELRKRISNKSKMILISSPNNPTGGVLNHKDIEIIADIANEHNLLVLSDEIYERIIYDETKIQSIASFNKIRDRVILVNGFSKTYAMTGWRLGYVVADRSVTEAINRIQQTSTTCPSSFVQIAGITALKDSDESIAKMIREYDQRRRLLVGGLNEIPGIKCPMPKGAFYVFPEISSTEKTSTEVAEKLLEDEGVCTTPGIAFGTYGENHLRLSYATSTEVISRALEKMRNFFSQLT